MPASMKKLNPVHILSFTLLVVMLGYGMILPVMPFYIEHFGAGGAEMGWLMSAYALMQLIFAPVWGIISDRVGRKPVLMLGILGYALALLLMGLAQSFWMLFVARVLSGVLSAAALPTAMAYVGDHTPEEERGSGMGQLGAATGVGVVTGPLLGGFLSGDDLSLPFLVGSAVAFLALFLVFLLLPETGFRKAAERRTSAPIKDALLAAGGPAGMMLVVIFVLSFGLTGFQGIGGLYVVKKFNFDTRQVGSMWMVMGAILVVGQGLLTGPLIRRFGERIVVLAGLGGGAAGFILLGLARDFTTTLLALGAFTLSLALSTPAINAVLSRMAGEKQGVMMGLNSSAASLGKVAGPLWSGYLFDMNIEYPYISGAAILLVDLLISLVVWRRLRNDRFES
jgi:DHA1 family multidrug resistance protein-like MFS transporter